MGKKKHMHGTCPLFTRRVASHPYSPHPSAGADLTLTLSRPSPPPLWREASPPPGPLASGVNPPCRGNILVLFLCLWLKVVMHVGTDTGGKLIITQRGGASRKEKEGG